MSAVPIDPIVPIDLSARAAAAFKSAVNIKWPVVLTAILSIAFYSWAINDLTNLSADTNAWETIIVQNVTPVIIKTIFGLLFMVVAGFIFISSYDNEKIYMYFTIIMTSISLALSILALAINNHTTPSSDTIDAFTAITGPIIAYVLLGSAAMSAVSCIFFTSFVNNTPAMNFSIIMSMFAMGLSITATGITRISRK